MSGDIKRREPGKRVFPPREHEKRRLGGATLVLVPPPPPQEPNRLAPQADPSREVQEMLREMNRRPAIARNTDTPDAA